MHTDDEPASQQLGIAHTFRPGDGASLWLGGDAYPMTVRRVSPSGRTVWTSEDRFRAKPGAGTIYDDPVVRDLHIPRDVPASEWQVFTRRKDSAHRPRGWKSGGLLVAGRSYRRDPCL